MPSATDRSFTLAFNTRPPIDCLFPRTLIAAFPLPRPLLRGLGNGESPAPGLWSDWLANWGWSWSVSYEACLPTDPMLAFWSGLDNWPPGFDARALSLAVALKMKIDGVPLGSARPGGDPDLQRTWHQIASLDEDALGRMLALALLRGEDIFDFASVCPRWPEDVATVIAERQPLARVRAPDPLWLALGYEMLGSAFEGLRGLGASFDDCLAVHEDFVQGRQIPAAFHMAFWWEAAYCLTERHAYPDAESAQARVAEIAAGLETQTGMVDPLWHHQQGRLHYYAGNHADALAGYLRELQVHGDDRSVQAMLERELANVLSDLGCHDAAARFALASIEHARSEGQTMEHYKSLGRLAEIRLKQGNPEEAEKLFEASLALQKKLADNRAPAQTLTYLGHVALLRGDHEAAGARYEEAERHDKEGSSTPYLAMGRFALAARQGNAVALDQLWRRHLLQLREWRDHPTHVLPAVACVLCAQQTVAEARSVLADFSRALLDSRYAIEALPAIAALPEAQQRPLMLDAIALLKRWQSALASLPPALKEIAGPLNAPSRLIESLGAQHPLALNDAQLAMCYPMSLACPVRC